MFLPKFYNYPVIKNNYKQLLLFFLKGMKKQIFTDLELLVAVQE